MVQRTRRRRRDSFMDGTTRAEKSQPLASATDTDFGHASRGVLWPGLEPQPGDESDCATCAAPEDFWGSNVETHTCDQGGF